MCSRCLVFTLVGLLCIGCAGPGTLTISYELGKASGVHPSYQTAIWLEDTNGSHVQSLFVSEYLSYCGGSYSTICPEWIRAADWKNVSRAELDAVTGATPRVKGHSLAVDCGERRIAPGTYRYCVQTHIVENHNILFRGEIDIGQMESKNVAMTKDHEKVPPGARAVLGKVEAHFKPNQSWEE